MSRSRVSSHFSGIGPEKLILQGFLPAAIHKCGLDLELQSEWLEAALLCGTLHSFISISGPNGWVVLVP